METSNKTFLELIKDFTIKIPIIQRDYAQGRAEEKEKRDKFLDVIHKHLTKNIPLDLDFVYGRIKDKVFYPIDGQQRLTTLFLLHWYVSIKKDVIAKSEKNNLVKFVYDTRISSREFCETLIQQEFVIPSIATKDNFIIEIQNNHWFRNEWKNDPTIKAMLTMIQAIHEKFINFQGSKLWDGLTKDRIISFQVLDLGAKGFELTDELYIKMNARGKQLTSFENFKANFIQFIERNFKEKKLEHPIKGEISYAGYFSYKVEKEWTDLFWAFRAQRTIVDDMFMNFFGYVSQICYFRSHKDAKAEDFNNNFEQYEEIFRDENNLKFLFNTFDKLFEITSEKGHVEKNKSQDFFELLFLKGEINESYNGQVRLFWNGPDDINLFEKCLNEGLNSDARNKIILFCIIHYLVKHNSNDVTVGLKHYIRIIRNLLQATRQRNDTKYNTNVRINNFGSYYTLFEQLATENAYKTIQLQIDNKRSQISDLSLKNEIVKAKIVIENDSLKNSLFSLEENTYFGGLIHQLKPENNIEKLKQYSDAVREIWNNQVSDTLIIQALIACDFGGIYIKECRMGGMWYFGKSGNWITVLTNEEERISKSIILLLNSYLVHTDNSPEKRLKAIIDDWLEKNIEDRSWKYYFLIYSDFTLNRNYYARQNDYEIRILGSESSNPLLAYHINPYVLTICRLIGDKKICDEIDCYQQYTGNSPLILNNGATLTASLDGWCIDKKMIILSNEILKKYKLEDDSKDILLREMNGKDRIEIAVDFIKDLYNKK